MFIRFQANVWYNLEHHTVRRNDYTTGESNVCEFFGFQNPMFNASFGDILKIKDLQIFKIQRPLEKKYTSNEKMVCTWGYPGSMNFPGKKELEA